MSDGRAFRREMQELWEGALMGSPASPDNTPRPADNGAGPGAPSPPGPNTSEARELVAAEDRAAEVRLYGEEHVARLEAEANRG